jgi:hypothetical protein
MMAQRRIENKRVSAQRPAPVRKTGVARIAQDALSAAKGTKDNDYTLEKRKNITDVK